MFVESNKRKKEGGAGIRLEAMPSFSVPRWAGPFLFPGKKNMVKQRNPQMNATASALSLVLKTRSTEVKIGSYCLIREMQI